jgi:hypothetical protein
MGHAPGCRCRLHVAAALVRPVDVLIIARHWQRGIGATRARATR